MVGLENNGWGRVCGFTTLVIASLAAIPLLLGALLVTMLLSNAASATLAALLGGGLAFLAGFSVFVAACVPGCTGRGCGVLFSGGWLFFVVAVSATVAAIVTGFLAHDQRRWSMTYGDWKYGGHWGNYGGWPRNIGLGALALFGISIALFFIDSCNKRRLAQVITV